MATFKIATINATLIRKEDRSTYHTHKGVKYMEKDTSKLLLCDLVIPFQKKF